MVAGILHFFVIYLSITVILSIFFTLAARDEFYPGKWENMNLTWILVSIILFPFWIWFGVACFGKWIGNWKLWTLTPKDYKDYLRRKKEEKELKKQALEKQNKFIL